MTVKEFIDKARAAGQDAFGIANDQEAQEILDWIRDGMGKIVKANDISDSEARMHEHFKNLTAHEKRFSIG